MKLSELSKRTGVRFWALRDTVAYRHARSTGPHSALIREDDVFTGSWNFIAEDGSACVFVEETGAAKLTEDHWYVMPADFRWQAYVDVDPT